MTEMHYDILSVQQSQTLSENGEIQPYYTINASLAMTVNNITEIFLKLAKEKNFMPVENDKGQVLIIKRKSVGVKDLLMQCLFPQSLDKNVSAIKLSIITNKLQCKRKITIKGLRGNVDENQKFLIDFESAIKSQKKGSFDQDEQTLNNHDQTINPSKQSEEDETQYNIQIQIDDDNEASSNPFTLESTANYMFQKILCAQAYGVGKKVSEFISDFQNNYRNIKESALLLPRPMEGIIALVNEVVDNLFSDFNYGKSETKTVMPYCKISVEKYVFGKLNENLYSMYKQKYSEFDAAFKQKQQLILEKTSIIQIFKFLESKRRYWLIQNEETFEDDLKNNPAIRPYNDAIRELEKIQFCNSPREKLKCTMMMRSMMRAGVIDFHKGREELASMDDELPIVIYIILTANIPNLFSELQIVEDFIYLDPTIETEQRFLTNIKVAGEYISKEWEVKN